MSTKTLSVSAIENGSVIDHIPAGQGLRIVRLLGLEQHQKCMFLGLCLPSLRYEEKDLIKVVDWKLCPDHANQVALLAPEATVSIIRNYDIQEKYRVCLPETLRNVLRCPNLSCVSRHEPIDSLFHLNQSRGRVVVTCHYCDQACDEHQLSYLHE